jgi:hypothetical protein
MGERIRVPDYLAARGDLDIEDRFFTQLRIGNGVFKMTSRHRFDDTLSITMDLIARHPGRVIDLACSSGVSTVELADELARRGIEREVHATDVAVHATYLERGDFGVLLAGRDEVLQIDHPRWAVARRPTKRDLVLHPLRALHAVAVRDVVLTGANRATRVPLVSSLVAASRVILHEEDLRNPCVPGTFGFVRVANILNRSYFTGAELRELVAAIVGRIADGGFVFVVRTHEDGSNHGTFFERRAAGMAEVARVGSGSEISELVRHATLAR